jgi:hypothetical protein
LSFSHYFEKPGKAAYLNSTNKKQGKVEKQILIGQGIFWAAASVNYKPASAEASWFPKKW